MFRSYLLPRTLGVPPPTIADAVQVTQSLSFEVLRDQRGFPVVGMILTILEFTTGPLISIFSSSFLPTLL